MSKKFSLVNLVVSSMLNNNILLLVIIYQLIHVKIMITSFIYIVFITKFK